jgi:hypothetical protein
LLASVFDKTRRGSGAARVRAWWGRMQLPRAHALLCPVCDIWGDD